MLRHCHVALFRALDAVGARSAAAVGSSAGVRSWASAALPAEQEPPAADSIEKKGISLRGRPLYLDMQATTPVDPRVIDTMLPYMCDQFGNPHSRTHLYGWESEEAVEVARKQIASLINADPKEIFFTSGATESNNMAVKGVASFYKEKKKHVITLQTEHKCVLDSCRYLQQHGFDVTYLPVTSEGLLDLNELKKAIRPDTSLVSVMAINNEIGVIQPMKEIADIVHKAGAFLHCDAAQAVGKVPVDVKEMGVDLMSISGHKLYGPKGVGAIYVRRRPRVRLDPIFSGGGQERGLRSGTVATPLAVGLGKACEIAQKDMDIDTAHIKRLEAKLREGLRNRLPNIQINGPEDLNNRYPGNLNVSFAYVEGESLIMGLKEIAVSSGSACTSASLEPSYVLRALGVEEDMAHTSIRYGIGRFTTDAEVERAIDMTAAHVEKLREMSPLWEMVQEGINIQSIQWAQH